MVLFVRVGKPRQQASKQVGHIGSIADKQRRMNASAQLTFSILHTDPCSGNGPAQG